MPFLSLSSYLAKANSSRCITEKTRRVGRNADCYRHSHLFSSPHALTAAKRRNIFSFVLPHACERACVRDTCLQNPFCSWVMLLLLPSSVYRARRRRRRKSFGFHRRRDKRIIIITASESNKNLLTDLNLILSFIYSCEVESCAFIFDKMCFTFLPKVGGDCKFECLDNWILQ